MTSPPLTYYPVALDIRGRRCVVVGGGVVAERKAGRLLASGAAVTVIAPEVTATLAELARDRSLTLERRPYLSGDLDGAMLAFAATNRRETNAAVAAEARERGLLVCVADRPSDGTVSIPAAGRRGGFTVAVFTDGGSPLLAALARDRLLAALSDGFVALLDRVATLRRGTRGDATRPGPARWRHALDRETVALADAGEVDAAERRLRERLAAHEQPYEASARAVCPVETTRS